MTHTSPLGPLPRRRASSDIVTALRRDITSGRLTAGSRLPTETNLALHYRVSRPTMREAMRSLDTLGLIEVRHGDGAFVSADDRFLVLTALHVSMQLQHVGILDVLSTRELLGRESARRAAVDPTTEALEDLEDLLRQIDAVDPHRMDELVAALVAFQDAVAAMAGSALLLTLESALAHTLLEMQFAALRQRGADEWWTRSQGFQRDRRALVDAIAARDPDAAEAASITYVQRQRELIASHPDLSELELSDPRALLVAEQLAATSRRGRPPEDVASTREAREDYGGS